MIKTASFKPDHIWTKNERIYWSLHSSRLVVKSLEKGEEKKRGELDN
jgi:hypothetical protein